MVYGLQVIRSMNPMLVTKSDCNIFLTLHLATKMPKTYIHSHIIIHIWGILQLILNEFVNIHQLKTTHGKYGVMVNEHAHDRHTGFPEVSWR